MRLILKGKNFSCNNVTGKRRKSDFYETPYSMTEQLMDREKYLCCSGTLLEPACGNGAIVKVIAKRNPHMRITATDLSRGQDFLSHSYPSKRHTVVLTNPPFSKAEEFIKKAKTLADVVIMLLPLSYLHGQQRYESLYKDKLFPLSKVYVFTRYPMLGDALRDDGKYRTGMMVYAWFIWDRKTAGVPPTIHWIDNNAHIVRGKG